MVVVKSVVDDVVVVMVVESCGIAVELVLVVEVVDSNVDGVVDRVQTGPGGDHDDDDCDAAHHYRPRVIDSHHSHDRADGCCCCCGD